MDKSAFLRHLLWKKESRHPQAMYTDFYSETLGDEFRKARLDRLRDVQKERKTKDYKYSVDYLELGSREMREHKWREAAEWLSLGVCAAENGSDILPLLYKKRSKCFAHRYMYEEAEIDVELSSEASQNQQAQKTKHKINKTSSDRVQTSQVQRLSFSNEKFPNLASALEVRQNAEFGRHVVSARTIFKIECA